MTAYETREKQAGLGAVLGQLIFRPHHFFTQAVAKDQFPYLTFSAWLVGLALTLQLMDKILLTPGGLITGKLSSFFLILVMSFVFMGLFYLIGGVLFHFYAYLADSRKDMKNSLAVTVYAWMPFALMVFITKLGLIIAFGSKYIESPAKIPLLGMIIYGLLGASILYGWFLAIYGSILALGCRKIRAVLMLCVVPILWFALIFLLARYLGFMG